MNLGFVDPAGTTSLSGKRSLLKSLKNSIYSSNLDSAKCKLLKAE
jgi:hypothetical protein